MNKQITEDYVSVETAKLLKEKGFDVPSRSYYNNNDYLSFEHPKGFVSADSVYLLRPTHQMALKWLRKAHRIVLDIEFEANKGWTYYVGHVIMKTLSDGSTYIVDIQHCVWSDDVQQPYYKEYEQAVEAALKYVLENLI